MSARRAREVGIGVLLAGVSFLGVLYQVNESAAQGSADGRSSGVPKLLCPLH
jgi:hypothetical protein